MLLFNVYARISNINESLCKTIYVEEVILLNALLAVAFRSERFFSFVPSRARHFEIAPETAFCDYERGGARLTHR